jgi:hypothetical protein
MGCTTCTWKSLEQVVELGAHRREAAGLHLDAGVAPEDVDHEAVQRHLEAVAGLAHVQLQGGVERPLAPRPDALPALGGHRVGAGGHVPSLS